MLRYIFLFTVPTLNVLCVLSIISFSSLADEWQALLFTCFQCRMGSTFSFFQHTEHNTCTHNYQQCTFMAQLMTYVLCRHMLLLQACSSTAVHIYFVECTRACDNHLPLCTCVNILSINVKKALNAALATATSTALGGSRSIYCVLVCVHML